MAIARAAANSNETFSVDIGDNAHVAETDRGLNETISRLLHPSS